MHLIDTDARHSRRAFLRRVGHLGLAGAAMPLALNLAAIGEAAAQSATDYKALVCVFLFGGNDYANTVVPYDDPNYNLYSAIRGGGAGQAAGGIALAKASLTPMLLQPTTALAGGVQYALHPALNGQAGMGGLAGLFNTEGKVAVQLNVGPLQAPTTRAQYNSRTNLPPNLFSHNDQQSVWQASGAEGATVGWGGNIGDIVMGGNAQSLFTCVSVSGNAVFLSGDTALSYQVGSNGPVAISAAKTGNYTYGSPTVNQAMRTLLQQARTHELENEYTRVTTRAMGAYDAVNGAIGAAYPTGNVPANNGLASQLAMVARLIRGRDTLGAKRQVFFVSMGGFDLHDNLMANQPRLMTQLSDAMTWFYRETAIQGLADKVTTFTASDFGRTLASNGDGADHGWGSHHFVMGGAVKGKAFYGTPPPVSVGSTSADADQWHVGQGRLLPTTSVAQYAGTMAKWFGVADAQLDEIVPNLPKFDGTLQASGLRYPRDLGFMA